MTSEFDEAFDDLSAAIREKLAGVIREQADLLSAAQQRALRSLEQAPEETGLLERSCVVVPGATDLEFLVQAGGDMTTKNVREGSGVDYDYALAFEFGTSHQPARSFFYSTYRAMQDDMQGAIDQAVKEIVNE